MDFGSSDEDASHRGGKRPRAETDEEDVSSVASSSDSEVDEPLVALSSDSDVDEPPITWDLVHPTHNVMGPRRRRHRYGAGRARADDFMTILRLRSEVEFLRRQRDELLSLQYMRVLNTGKRDALVNTAIEYFDTFRDGFRGPRVPEMIRFFNTRTDQELFVYGGGNLGLDEWIEQWRRYTRLFAPLSIRLRSTNVVHLTEGTQEPTDPTIATYIIHTMSYVDGIFSRQAVLTIFPHLRTHEYLIEKLVGRSLHLPTDLNFYFNNSNRLIRIDLDGDYVEAVSNIEDIDLTELAQIMEHVAIGENTTIPVPVEINDDDDKPVATSP